jgi:hypothetical protein
MLYGHLPQVIGVIGAGQMGSGIAQVRANSITWGPAQVSPMVLHACFQTHDALTSAAPCAMFGCTNCLQLATMTASHADTLATASSS